MNVIFKQISLKLIQRTVLKLTGISFLLSILFINLYYLSAWYRIPHKEIHFEVQANGYVGNPSCTVYLGMNYGDNYCKIDSLGAYIIIDYPFKGISCSCTKQLCITDNVICLSSNSIKDISSIFHTVITMKSNLSDVMRPISKGAQYSLPFVNINQLPVNNIALNSTIAETYFNVLPEKRQYNCSCYNGVTLLANAQTDVDFINPGFESKGDISKLDCMVTIDIDERISCDTVTFYSVGPFSCFSANVEPDYVSFNKIAYFSPDKINRIKKNGLRFYSEFPEAAKLQNFRISLLLIAIPIILTSIFSLAYQLFKKHKRYIKIYYLKEPCS